MSRHCKCKICKTPTADGLWLCTEHTEELRASLFSVGDLLKDLDTAISKQDRTSANPGVGGSHGKMVEAPLPYRPEVVDVKDGLAETVGNWAVALGLDIRDATVPQTMNPKDATELKHRITSADLAARILADNIIVIVQCESAGVVHTEIMASIKDAYHVIDHKSARQYLGRCDCRTEVYVHKGAKHYTCVCGVAIDVRARRMQLIGHLEQRLSEYVGTATQIADLMCKAGHEVKTSQVHWWARSGKIKMVGRGPKNWPTYRYADALSVYQAKQRQHVEEASLSS